MKLQTMQQENFGVEHMSITCAVISILPKHNNYASLVTMSFSLLPIHTLNMGCLFVYSLFTMWRKTCKA